MVFTEFTSHFKQNNNCPSPSSIPPSSHTPREHPAYLPSLPWKTQRRISLQTCWFPFPEAESN